MAEPMAEHDVIEVEERPRLDLSAEEIAQREAEKAQLLAGIGIPTAEARAAVPRARRGKSRGDLVGDYEPPVLTVGRVVQLNAKPGQMVVLPPGEDPTKTHFMAKNQTVATKITADPATLASLMQDAKQTQEEAEAAEEMASSAKAAAVNARIRLNDYMRAHGLA